MQLEFGNPAHIEKAKEGQIPDTRSKTKIVTIQGCLEGCDHCIEVHYICQNCHEASNRKNELIIKFDHEERCKYCKFLIQENE